MSTYFRLFITLSAFVLATAGSVVAAADTIQIDFGPARAPVASDHQRDAGRVFSVHSTDMAYGWSRRNCRGRYRRFARSVPEAWRSHLLLRRGTSWELALENGRYAVELVCGDVRPRWRRNDVQIEGVVFPDPDGRRRDRFDVHTAEVEVTDGRLSIAAGPRARRVTICALSVRLIEPERRAIVIPTASRAVLFQQQCLSNDARQLTFVEDPAYTDAPAAWIYDRESDTIELVPAPSAAPGAEVQGIGISPDGSHLTLAEYSSDGVSSARRSPLLQNRATGAVTELALADLSHLGVYSNYAYVPHVDEHANTAVWDFFNWVSLRWTTSTWLWTAETGRPELPLSPQDPELLTPAGANGYYEDGRPSMSADGRMVLVQHTRENPFQYKIRLFDRQLGTARILADDAESGLIAGNGRVAVVHRRGVGLQVLDCSNGRVLAALPDMQWYPRAIDGSGNQVVFVSPDYLPGEADGELDAYIWRWQSGEVLRLRGEGAGAALQGSVDPTGQWAAVTSADRIDLLPLPALLDSDG